MDKDFQFKEAIENNRDKIYRICCCYFKDQNDRKDVFQEVLIHIWENLGTFQGRSQISTWIYRITVNTCLAFINKEKRRKKVITLDIRQEHEKIPEAALNEEEQQFEKKIQFLYEQINQLPAFDKTLISLYLEDLTTKEMSEILNISEANVRTKLHRIKKRLKNILEKYDNGT